MAEKTSESLAELVNRKNRHTLMATDAYFSFGHQVAFTSNLEWALPAVDCPSDLPGESR